MEENFQIYHDWCSECAMKGEENFYQYLGSESPMKGKIMAKTLMSIRINFNQTLRKAEELDELAAQLDDLAGSTLEETLRNVNSSWTGEASTQYQSKGRELERKIQESASRLRQIAAAMRTTAKVTYEAERQAILLAKN